MKQGTGTSRMGATKVEPMSKAVNPGKVADMGLQQVRMRPHKDLGRGYKAPMAESSTHKAGSQGKH
jgi:hypothetical protein